MEFDLVCVEELLDRDAELERFVFAERVRFAFDDERVELDRDADDDGVERCGREYVDEERDEEEEGLDAEDDDEERDEDDELDFAGGVYVLFFVCACADATTSVAPRINDANLFWNVMDGLNSSLRMGANPRAPALTYL